MTKNNETQKPATETTTEQTIETIETIALDDVTGGCAACGCGNPGANPGAAPQQQLYSQFRR